MKSDKFKDYIVGLIFAILGVFLVTSKKIVKGINMSVTDIPLAKADTYLRTLGGILTFLSVCLIVSAFVKQRKENGESKAKVLDRKTMLFTAGFFAAIIVYALLIKTIGFFFDTLWFTFLFSFALRIKELGLDIKDRKALTPVAVKSLIYALCLDGALIAIFTYVLKVTLP